VTSCCILGCAQKKRAETLAEVIAALPEPRPSGFWPSPLSVGELDYPRGTTWRLGDAHPKPRAVSREIAKPDVLVLEAVAPEQPHEIVFPDRQVYWNEVAPYYTETIDREPGDHTDYSIGLFEDANGRPMVYFERHC
jgi:hypothetical protein